LVLRRMGGQLLWRSLLSLTLRLATVTVSMAMVWFVRVRSVVLLLLGWCRRLLWGLPLLLEWVLWLNLVNWLWLLRLLSI